MIETDSYLDATLLADSQSKSYGTFACNQIFRDLAFSFADKNSLLIIVYHLFLLCYRAGIQIVSLGNKKARMWIRGRKKIFNKLRQTAAGFHDGPVVWMHCASLGEFEQGRPVLQKIRDARPSVQIVVSFFSPSGFEIVKNNPDFTHVFYLPMDSETHARSWMEIVNPQLVLWVKYEYWHYYLREIKRRGVPLLMVSGIYRKNQVFFRWYGGFYRSMLKAFDHFFVQNESSRRILEKWIPAGKTTVTGDTRCDRVIQIAANHKDVPGIERFCGERKVIVAGSTWEEDETEWTHFVRSHPELRFIIAPHEIDAENLREVQQAFHGSVFYSEWVNGSGVSGTSSPNCLIIDNIGMLSRLYHYATIAYVGGGFGYDGLHNILEAAVYGKPVIFGPEYDKNFEAEELIACSGGLSIENAIELEKVVTRLLEDREELRFRSEAAKNYVYQNAGASGKILSFIEKNGLL